MNQFSLDLSEQFCVGHSAKNAHTLWKFSLSRRFVIGLHINKLLSTPFIFVTVTVHFLHGIELVLTLSFFDSVFSSWMTLSCHGLLEALEWHSITHSLDFH